MTGNFNVGAFVCFILVCTVGAAGLGWVMNLQNLFQYGIENNKFLISLAGLFVFPIGCVAGWIW